MSTTTHAQQPPGARRPVAKAWLPRTVVPVALDLTGSPDGCNDLGEWHGQARDAWPAVSADAVAEPVAELPDDDVVPEPPLVELPAILLGPYSFLCGSAGTGKTYLARAMARQLSGTILAATTGIASVNLGEGTTINALLKYFDTASLRDNHVSGQLQAQLGRLWRAGIRRILLDEVSMMDGEQLTILTEALEELSGRGYVMDSQLQDEMDEADAWSGVQTSDAERRAPIALTLIGDFAQLPPVKAPFAFQSPAWGKFEPTTHRLTKIWRQSDVDFITAIQAARRGDPGPVIDYFGPRLQQTSDSEFPGPTILATNDAVARFNGLRLAKLTTPQHLFVTERWGVQRGDWKQIPDALGLKVGALVMLLSNRRELGIDGMPGPLVYANGDLATVDSLDAERKQCVVTLQRNGRQQIVDWVTRANTIPLEPGRRKALKAEGKENLISKDGRMETVGEVTYLPVRVAYATTVHKSQGLSLDKVQINTREGFFKTAGMLYVSLSRARTVEGLRLVGSVDGLRERCTVDTRVVPWL